METKHYKEKLEEELKLLEKGLGTIGRRSASNPADWEAVADVEMNKNSRADKNDNADNIEEYETRVAILNDLEIRFNNVKDALARIADNNYGKCETCGKEIEKERLEANPAARNCIQHKRN